jgi:hypothetical protein
MADQELQIEDDLTLSIDNSGPTPWLRWKDKRGDPVHEWKLMRITENGNLWLPEDMRK